MTVPITWRRWRRRWPGSPWRRWNDLPLRIPAGLGGLVLAGGAYATGAYRSAMAAADARLARRSSLIDTEIGPLEYAIAGDGPPMMMIHGSGGVLDQGLLFAHALREQGFRIIAPSRFGYLRSGFPDDASGVTCDSEQSRCARTPVPRR